MLQKNCYIFCENYIRKDLSNGHSAKVYTLEIYPLHGTQQFLMVSSMLGRDVPTLVGGGGWY